MATTKKTSTVPATAKQPQDRKPTKTVKADLVELDWRGVHIVVDADPDNWPPRAVKAFEEGKVITGMSGLVGETTMNKLLDKAERMAEVGELWDQIAKATGLDSGN